MPGLLDSSPSSCATRLAQPRLFRAELLVDMALAGQTSVRGITRDAVDYVNY
jgi:hypothetical protein